MLERVLDSIRSLSPMHSIDPGVPVLDQDQLAERVGHEAPVVVLFYADWCGFCRVFVPTFERVVDEVEIEAVAANISDYQDPRWDTYQVDVVPTLVAFRGGEVIERADGQAGRGLTDAEVVRFVRALRA